jgi:hypothetical protein
VTVHRSFWTLLPIGVVVALTAVTALAGPQAHAAAGSPQPGTVVSAAPTAVRLTPLVRLPTRAWALTYRSTSATGAPNVVSGTLLVPARQWRGRGPRPIVSYAVGTHGLGDQCAPSRRLADGTEIELLLIGQALLRGWAVAVTDYEGLGTPGPHTYLVSRSAGHAVLDIVRAAVRVPDAGLSPQAPIGLWGFSQGGMSAGAAAEQAASYAPELDVRGAAVGGVPADLAEVVADVRDRASSTGVVVALSTGYDAAYDELDLRGALSPQGQALYDDVGDDCVDEINRKSAAYTPAMIAPADLLTSGVAGDRIAENRVGGVAPAFPAFVYHGSADETVPVRQGRELREDWCADGGRVRYVELPGVGHVDGALAGGPLAAAWLSAGFAGSAAPSGC